MGHSFKIRKATGKTLGLCPVFVFNYLNFNCHWNPRNRNLTIPVTFVSCWIFLIQIQMLKQRLS